jgi:protein-tyrosine-phosphatase
VTRAPQVAFVCFHNAGRSQIERRVRGLPKELMRGANATG